MPVVLEVPLPPLEQRVAGSSRRRLRLRLMRIWRLLMTDKAALSWAGDSSSHLGLDGAMATLRCRAPKSPWTQALISRAEALKSRMGGLQSPQAVSRNASR